MAKIACASAIRFLRKMRGGSQPILVEACDHHLYVVKSQDNLQGPNVPLNEVLGTELYRQAGLPTPEWSLIYLSDGFLDRNPTCALETTRGLRRRKSGWCFGSRMLGSNGSRVLEILPGSHFSRIRNRCDFVMAWVLDVLCGHADHRQAIFVEEPSRALEACFIDHGHLLAGPDGNATPSICASWYLDRKIYTDLPFENADRIVARLRCMDPEALAEVLNGLPEAWNRPQAKMRFEGLKRKLSDRAALKSTVRALLRRLESARRKHDDAPAAISIGRLEGATLRPEIPAFIGRDRVARWDPAPARPQAARANHLLRA